MEREFSAPPSRHYADFVRAAPSSAFYRPDSSARPVNSFERNSGRLQDDRLAIRVCGWLVCDVNVARSRWAAGFGTGWKYITNLKDRVKWLESIIHEKCPYVDLSQGPNCEKLKTVLNGESTSVVAQVEPVASNPGQNESRTASSHEIGLVSLGGSQDPRYIGPSSGYFLARVMLTKGSSPGISGSRHMVFPTDLIETVQSAASLPAREIADQICDAFFESLHTMYPVLHRPTFNKVLDKMYTLQYDDPPACFQVYMVMALGSLVVSQRLKAILPCERYGLSALRYFDRINVENSLQGLQCLLLLLIFTLHNPHVRVNIWHLNYQAIAAAVDLGLQRDVTTQAGISLLEQEMRTRIFWVVFMMDRIIATTMGRPIGLRDEACDLRLPRILDDMDIMTAGTPHSHSSAFKPIAYSIHLFRLAKLNSEIKYVANSVVRQTPVYAYPAVIDIYEWQASMLEQINQWEEHIPTGDGTPATQHLETVCRIQGHTLRMVLLRPSPAIPRPTREALEKCHSSARESLKLLNKLYVRSTLIHSWLTFHAVVLSTLSILYCVKMVPDLRHQTDIPELMSDLSISSSILSATGEHWSGARRCRDILDELGRSTIKDLLAPDAPTPARESSRRRGRATVQHQTAATTTPISLSDVDLATDARAYTPMIEPSAFFDDFLGNDSFANCFPDESSSNIDEIVRNMFQDDTTATAFG
ncbi:C6 transcription factor, putative [Metarhizium acridum CQMa 102]|uniref:C6 transcription factor, putative n=1 Tax=Metarhizium acridum (strain CQMa 102) TaxID=655827 RepID=E9E0C6_METAQ|nr:C6 transcription factor, putative [Metarhizium acridum CQMa 102]EFY90546.1 C6 transcription factor, putative [Metarhizium acridum CQMa 102]